jgi:lysophospholipase L1-like esterase
MALLAALVLAGCTEPPGLAPLAPDAVVLAFGDSLTHGTGASREQAYPAVLEGLIGRKVVNAGVPGELSGEGVERLPGALRRHRPDLVILCHGGNDLLRKRPDDLRAANLRRMISMSHDAGAQVVLVSVPRPAILLSGDGLYEQIGEALGVPVEEDALADILQNPRLKSDHVHPNAAGYRRLAEALAGLLQDRGAL